MGMLQVISSSISTMKKRKFDVLLNVFYLHGQNRTQLTLFYYCQQFQTCSKQANTFTKEALDIAIKVFYTNGS